MNTIRPATAAIAISMTLVIGVHPAHAHDARQSVELAVEQGRTAASDDTTAGQAAEDDFQVFVRRQASLELQIGLRNYQTYDDFRAISALNRYQVLAASPAADYLASLMIGQIYHRNDKPELAVLAFERAFRAAPDDHHRTFSYLLAVQESCLALSYYAACRQRLADLAQQPLQDAVRDLVDYQVLYTDVVLRSPYVTQKRANLIREPVLKRHADALIERDQAFHDLPIKRPWLSGTLSGVLPGAGQLYNGRPWEALLSFTINALFGAATYYSFAKLDNVPLGIASGVFALGFYSGNIVNAVTDAKRINARLYLDFFDQLKVDHWPRVNFQIRQDQVHFAYEFDWPGPTLESRAKQAAEETTGGETKPDP